MGNYPTKLYSNKINWMMMRVPKVVVRLIWLIYESVPEHCSNIEFVEILPIFDPRFSTQVSPL
jgi:hypothetical protein